MAQFNIEFEKLILAEGGYICDPDDAGGETYLGISRKYNSDWYGWKFIDDVKKKYGAKNIISILKKDENLTNAAKNLYKERYWDVMELDDIPNQNIAHQMFDTCVNMGFKAAINIAQQVIGMSVTGKWSDELKYNLMKYDN